MSKRAVEEFLRAKKIEQGKATVVDKGKKKPTTNNTGCNDPKRKRIRVM